MSWNVQVEQHQEEKRLRQVVEREWKVLQRADRTDVESRKSCVHVLDAVDVFLGKLEKLHHGTKGFDSRKVAIPRKFVDEILLKIVQELGPGDTLIRTSWFPTLKSTAKSCVIRELVLDFLPCALPSKPDETVKAELLDIFKHLIEVDCTAIPQSLKSLSELALIGKLEDDEIFQFCISKVISKTPDEFIHHVIQCMLQHMSDDVDSKNFAIEIIRGEVFSIEEAQTFETSHYVSSIANVLLHAFHSDKYTQKLFYQGYIAEVEQESKSHEAVLSQNCEDKDSPYTCLDLLVLLMHRNHKDHRFKVKHTLEGWISSNMISKRQLNTLVNIASLAGAPDSNQIASSEFWDFLSNAVTWFLSFLLLYSAQKPQEDLSQVLTKIKSFSMDITSKTRQPIQEKVISTLLRTAQELRCSQRVADSSKDINRLGGICESGAANRLESFIFNVLTSLARKSPHYVHQHMEEFLQVLQREVIPSDMLENVCKLIAYTHRYNRESEKGNDCDDTLLVTRRLLFSRGNEFVLKGSKEDKGKEMTVRGLALVTELVLSGHLEQSFLCLMWTSVRMILANIAKRSVHPCISAQALRAVRAFHVRSFQGNEYATKIGQELFPVITKVLSSSRLVQYVQGVNLQPNHNTTIAYSNFPDCFSFQRKQSKGQIMSFNFDIVTGTHQFMNPGNWTETAVWVFELVDTYLTLGRHASKTKWIPHSWVEANIEFPVLDLSRLGATSERQQKSIGQIHDLFNNYGAEHESLCTKSIKDFFDAMRSMKKNQDRSELTTSMLHCALSLTLGLSISVAILKNTYGRYESAINNSNLDDMSLVKRTATGLIQFQLVKVFDLFTKCKAVESLLRSGVTTRGLQRRGGSRPRRKPSSILGNMNIHNDVRIAVEQLSSIMSFFKTSDEYIRFKALWFSLVDSKHDEIIITALQDRTLMVMSTPRDTQADLECIFNLRSGTIGHIVDCLQRAMDQRSNTGNSRVPVAVENELAQIRPYFAQCLRLAAHMSLKLSSLEKSQYDSRLIARLTSLTSDYFRLLALTMQVILGLSSELSMNYSDFLSLFQSILEADKPLTDAITLDGAKIDNAKEETSTGKLAIFNSVLRHLRLCKDAKIAAELLECVSIFALSSDDEASLAEVLQISWAALHTQFASTQWTSAVILPQSFVEAIKILSPLSLHRSGNMSERATIIHETVVKVALSKSKNMEEHLFLLWGLLRHWGFLVLIGGASSVLVDHLYQLIMHLSEFLNDMKESEVQRVKGDTSEEEEDLPRDCTVQQSVHVYHQATIPCLDSKSFAVYCEIILDMIVAATALFEAQEGAEWVDVSFGPFKNLCSLAENFGLMISLYETRIQAFPSAMISSVSHTCAQMLNAVSYQAIQCAEWRSSQPAPTPEDIASNTFDPASVRFIHEMLDSFESHVAGRLVSLCDKIDSVTSKDSRKHDQKIPSFGPIQKRKTRTLRQKIEKARSNFESLAVAHKLPGPREKVAAVRVDEGAEQSQPSRKRRRVEIKSLLQLEDTLTLGSQKLEDIGLPVHRRKAASQQKWKPKIQHLAHEQVAASGDDSSEGSWEEGSFFMDESSEDSFEVSGNW